MKRLKTVVTTLAFMACLYAIIISMLYLFQSNLIFLPTPIPKAKDFDFKYSHIELFLEHENEERINALYFKSPGKSKGLVLYFHGNAKNLGHWGEIAGKFLERNHDVFMIDYRGYGKSDGEASEENLFEDGLLSLQWALNNYPEKDIIIYGRSLGSAVATYASQNTSIKMLVLESPLSSIQDVVVDRFPFLLFPLRPENNFSNLDMMDNVNVPIHIIHGSEDDIIPLSAAKKLVERLKKGDSFTIIEGGGHNDLSSFDKFFETLDTLIK